MKKALSQQHGFNAISLMPTNLYGPGDNFDLRHSHVLPALLRKFVEAKESGAPEVTIWAVDRRAASHAKRRRINILEASKRSRRFL
jgi:GDP-L-fucose synthase